MKQELNYAHNAGNLYEATGISVGKAVQMKNTVIHFLDEGESPSHFVEKMEKYLLEHPEDIRVLLVDYINMLLRLAEDFVEEGLFTKDVSEFLQ